MTIFLETFFIAVSAKKYCYTFPPNVTTQQSMTSSNMPDPLLYVRIFPFRISVERGDDLGWCFGVWGSLGW